MLSVSKSLPENSQTPRDQMIEVIKLYIHSTYRRGTRLWLSFSRSGSFDVLGRRRNWSTTARSQIAEINPGERPG